MHSLLIGLIGHYETFWIKLKGTRIEQQISYQCYAYYLLWFWLVNLLKSKTFHREEMNDKTDGIHDGSTRMPDCNSFYCSSITLLKCQIVNGKILITNMEQFNSSTRTSKIPCLTFFFIKCHTTLKCIWYVNAVCKYLSHEFAVNHKHFIYFVHNP